MQRQDEYRRHLARMRAELWKIRQMVDAIDPWHEDYRFFGMVPDTGELSDRLFEADFRIPVRILKENGVPPETVDSWAECPDDGFVVLPCVVKKKPAEPVRFLSSAAFASGFDDPPPF